MVWLQKKAPLSFAPSAKVTLVITASSGPATTESMVSYTPFSTHSATIALETDEEQSNVPSEVFYPFSNLLLWI